MTTPTRTSRGLLRRTFDRHWRGVHLTPSLLEVRALCDQRDGLSAEKAALLRGGFASVQDRIDADPALQRLSEQLQAVTDELHAKARQVAALHPTRR